MTTDISCVIITNEFTAFGPELYRYSKGDISNNFELRNLQRTLISDTKGINGLGSLQSVKNKFGNNVDVSLNFIVTGKYKPFLSKTSSLNILKDISSNPQIVYTYAGNLAPGFNFQQEENLNINTTVYSGPISNIPLKYLIKSDYQQSVLQFGPNIENLQINYKYYVNLKNCSGEGGGSQGPSGGGSGGGGSGGGGSGGGSGNGGGASGPSGPGGGSGGGSSGGGRGSGGGGSGGGTGGGRGSTPVTPVCINDTDCDEGEVCKDGECEKAGPNLLWIGLGVGIGLLLLLFLIIGAVFLFRKKKENLNF